ncbi:MAG: winged helix-turn-helix transcriptional regulator [Candidatus Promineofilum sp.]|nr:winged helix-turn-helix transcriptional regulator [Promineifilum sp.]
MSTNEEQLIRWDIGTAYDFFASLVVLHNPERYGLRGSWAAGVRSRLPAAERETLQSCWEVLWPMRWVYTLPAPKDAATALAVLEQATAATRLRALMAALPPAADATLYAVAARRAWDEPELRHLTGLMQESDWRLQPPAAVRKLATHALDLWSDPAGSADALLSALSCYHEVFFAEEEARLRPQLDAALAYAQTLAARLPPPALLEELSQGLRLATENRARELVLAPSFWATPFVVLTMLDEETALFVYGARPADMSLVPGELVPDALYQALKALADPTRLRILRYLSDEPLAPAQLARRLRLRSPTVIHHLDALRLARLVIVTLEPEGKRYAMRPDALATLFDMLTSFVDGREE